ncbi:MAG: hypothetical protein KBT36_03775, partial [Kurthia sp.]|nr:hypothetical protein [Candidatus Kurthia equi]
MEKNQVGQIMMMIEASFNNRLKSNNPNLTFNIYVDMLKDYDYSYVINNLKYHIQHSQFPPTIHDL